MKSLQDLMGEAQVTLTPDFSGVLFRGGHNNCEWFVGYQGEGGYRRAWFGNWKGKPPEGQDYWSWEGIPEGMSEVALDAEREKSEAHQEQAREQKRKAQEEVAPILEAEFNQFIERGTTPYMERKLIDQLYGARIKPNEHGDPILVVPLRDINGKFWNYQRIYSQKVANGVDKFMAKNARISGCFHVLEGAIDGKEIYICEGFATACSIRQGLNGNRFAVLSAFSATNLSAVARDFRKTFPLARIILCADNDAYTKRPDGTPWNPGLEAALEAAKACQGEVRYPIFKAPKPGLTDFNDLHAAEGLEEVARQLASPPPDELRQNTQNYADCPITPLGYSGSVYYYTSVSNPQINAIREHSEMDLLKLMPLRYWEDQYGFQKGKSKALAINWGYVKSELTEMCRKNGIFENKRIKGLGVWLDQGKTVVHLGDRLFYGGSEHPIDSIKSNSIYEFSKRLSPLHPRALGASETGPLLQVLSALNYASPEQKLFLGGWLMLSGICGALHWRPHLWLTGEQGSGKSTVLNEIIRPILEAFQCLNVQGATTEAGLRQTLRGNAIPVLFDEFEPDTRKSAARVEAVLELLRQSSSDQGGAILKGSATGEAVEYHARFAAIVSSVQTKLIAHADKARFTLVELKKVENNTHQWEALKAALVALTPEFCSRLFARSVVLVPTILENQVKLQAAFAKRHSHRFGQQYGSLLAGHWALDHDGPIQPEEVQGLVNQVILENEVSSSSTKDHEECLEHLLYKILRVETKAKTVFEMLQDQEVPGSHDSSLETHGVFKTKHQGKDAFLVANNHPELSAIFRETRWAGSWSSALGRLPGAIRSKRVLRGGNKSPSGTLLIMDCLDVFSKS